MNPNNIDPSSSCSDDLADAGRLSSSLRGTPLRPPEVQPYTRLSPRAERPAAPPGPPPDLAAGHGWNALLEACAEYVHAAECFIVDSSGLPVASRGFAGGAGEIEKIGSRVALAFDIADQMAGRRCRHISIDLVGRVLTGIHLPDQEGERLTLGILSEAPLDASILEGLLGPPPPAES